MPNAYLQGIQTALDTQSQIRNDVSVVALNWFVNRCPLVTRVPRVPVGSTTFSIVSRSYRSRVATVASAIDAADTQIVPLVIGDPAAAVSATERALERGVFAQAIRPPTVPDGTARLRLAAMATHRPAELAWAARQLAAAAREADADTSGPLTGGELFVYDAALDEPAFQHAA
jgi:hypothetical protein